MSTAHARLVALCLPLLFAACARPGPSPQAAATSDTVPLAEGLDFGAPLAAGRLTVWTVYGPGEPAAGRWLTLTQAQERGLVEIREVGGGSGEPGGQVMTFPDQVLSGELDPGPQHDDAPVSSSSTRPAAPRRTPPPPVSTPAQGQSAAQARQEAQVMLGDAQQEQVSQQLRDGAQVGRVVIENKGDLPILVCAGTLVKGGQQDRQIGQDYTILARSAVPVDAYCVEHGRWTNLRGVEDTGGQFQVMYALAAKTVRQPAQYEKAQTTVWQNVSTANAAMGVAPSSGTFLASMDDVPEQVIEEREALRAAVLAHVTAADDAGRRPIGFAYAVDGHPMTLRTFATPELLASQVGAFASAMALEATTPATREPATPDVRTFQALLDALAGVPEEVEQTEAGNRNRYRRSEQGYAATCEVPRPGGGWMVLTRDWTAR